MYQRIVVPLDGSKLAKGCWSMYCAPAHCMGSEVILMRVLMAYPAYDYLLTWMSASLREQMEQDACNYLEPLANAFQDEGIGASADAVVARAVADAIIEFARDKADRPPCRPTGAPVTSRSASGGINSDRAVRCVGMPRGADGEAGS